MSPGCSAVQQQLQQCMLRLMRLVECLPWAVQPDSYPYQIDSCLIQIDCYCSQLTALRVHLAVGRDGDDDIAALAEALPQLRALGMWKSAEFATDAGVQCAAISDGQVGLYIL